MTDKIFVPIALEMEEAEHTFGAVRAVFDSCVMMKRPTAEYAPLARAMLAIGEAIDKRREKIQ